MFWFDSGFRICGKSPFDGKEFKEILELNKKCQITFSESQFKRYPAEGVDLLKRMLETDPNKRVGAIKALTHPYFIGLSAPDSLSKDESNVEDCNDEEEIASNISNFQKK